jgi:Phage capsid family
LRSPASTGQHRQDDILRVLALQIDSATLNGAGTNGQSPGILTVTANSGGSYDYKKRSPDVTFNSAATYDKVMQFYKNVESANFDLEDQSAAFIVSPKTKARWKVVPMAVNYPRYLRTGGTPDNICDGLCRWFSSKMMDSALAGQVLFAKWSECCVFSWSGLDIVSDHTR